MAQSPSHRFGQIIGNLLEEILLPTLEKFCTEKGLYLDKHGERVGVRAGKKVSWEDRYGNVHNLDFVIERNGSVTKQGNPVAFIEAAWRRYTKHSRNKAQEIQGAVLPIAEKYRDDSPFLGAVLAGFFTQESLDQLKSVGFEIVYLPYEDVVSAFRSVGIDINFDETTSDRKFTECIRKIEALTPRNRAKVKTALVAANRSSFDSFFERLQRKLRRLITRVVILPLYGGPIDLPTITAALSFIFEFRPEKREAVDFQKYEILIVFSNGDELRGIFSNKEDAIDFLRKFS